MLRNPILLAAAMLLASSAALSQETSRPAAAASAPEAGSSSKVIRPPIDGAMTPAKPAYPVQAGQGKNHGAPKRQSALPAPLPRSEERRVGKECDRRVDLGGGSHIKKKKLTYQNKVTQK